MCLFWRKSLEIFLYDMGRSVYSITENEYSKEKDGGGVS